MPTVTVSYDFPSDAQSWVGFDGGAESSTAYVSDDGSPANGCLSAEISTSISQVTHLAGWLLQTTWAALGVPAGATVTHLTCTTVRQRTAAFTGANPVENTNFWGVQLWNTANVQQAILISSLVETEVEGAWSGDIVGTAKAVPHVLQGAASTVRLVVLGQLSTDAAELSANVEFRWDHLSFEITYGRAPVRLPGAAPWAQRWRHWGA